MTKEEKEAAKAAKEAEKEAAKAAAAAEEPEVAVEKPSKAEFRKLIEAYKKANPVKYALKEAELAKKLAAL